MQNKSEYWRISTILEKKGVVEIMNLEIEHNGIRCTKALIDGKPFGKYVEGLDIHIEGGEKPIVIMKTRADTLKINGQEVYIYREKSKINIKERISRAISKIRYRKIQGGIKK